MKADRKTEAEVMAVLDELGDAYSRRDIHGLLDLFVPDPDVFLLGTGADEKRVGLDEIRAQAERDWSQSDSTSLRLGWHLVSTVGPVAWVATDATFEARLNGQVLKLPGRLTAVLEKRDNRWLVAQTHFSFPSLEQGQGDSFPT